MLTVSTVSSRIQISTILKTVKTVGIRLGPGKHRAEAAVRMRGKAHFGPGVENVISGARSGLLVQVPLIAACHPSQLVLF